MTQSFPRKETHRVLRRGGRTGFTCGTKPSWIPAVQEAVPSFQPPPFQSRPGCHPEFIQGNLETTGFSEVRIETLDFSTEEDLEGYFGAHEAAFGKGVEW